MPSFGIYLYHFGDVGLKEWTAYDKDKERMNRHVRNNRFYTMERRFDAGLAAAGKMTESLAHRGPDGSGTWISNPCAFGHRRLSVIDPENGAQPMIIHQEEEVYAIVYNGNYIMLRSLKTNWYDAVIVSIRNATRKFC